MKIISSGKPVASHEAAVARTFSFTPVSFLRIGANFLKFYDPESQSQERGSAQVRRSKPGKVCKFLSGNGNERIAAQHPRKSRPR
jgi:hypothetical protein